MKAGIAKHVRAAIAEADAIVFVTDATTGPSGADRAAIQLLRESGKPVLLRGQQGRLARASTPRRSTSTGWASSRSTPSARCTAAASASSRRQSSRRCPSAVPGEPDDERGPPRIALVGPAQRGQVEPLNRILGEDRMLVDARPGTTRDAIDALVKRGDKQVRLIDTAGIRRKSKVAQGGERGRVDERAARASASIERAHVVVLLCDAGRRRRRAGREDPGPRRGARARDDRRRSTRAICSTRTS